MNDPSRWRSVKEPEYIVKVAEKLFKRLEREERDARYASAMKVLSYLGMGASIAAMFLVSNAGRAFGKLWINPQRYDWKKFNTRYLRQTLRRLEKQKLVERVMQGEQEVLKITDRGKTRILKHTIYQLEIKQSKHWDGRWRLVLYDIPKHSKYEQEELRRTLKNLGFYPMQESAYIFPFPCKEEVDYIRSYFELANVKYIVASHIEDDEAYRTYFGL